jgi:hypothetical protein
MALNLTSPYHYSISLHRSQHHQYFTLLHYAYTTHNFTVIHSAGTKLYLTKQNLTSCHYAVTGQNYTSPYHYWTKLDDTILLQNLTLLYCTNTMLNLTTLLLYDLPLYLNFKGMKQHFATLYHYFNYKILPVGPYYNLSPFLVEINDFPVVLDIKHITCTTAFTNLGSNEPIFVC